MTDQNNSPEETPEDKPKRTVTEEIEVAGGQVINQLKNIVREGNVRRVIVKTADGRVLLDTTLALGAVGGGLAALIGGLPLAALGMAAAVIARIKIEIVREVDTDTIEDDDGEPITGAQRIEIVGNDDDDDEGDAPSTENDLSSDE